jgi:hypothetical protein
MAVDTHVFRVKCKGIGLTVGAKRLATEKQLIRHHQKNICSYTPLVNTTADTLVWPMINQVRYCKTGMQVFTANTHLSLLKAFQV